MNKYFNVKRFGLLSKNEVFSNYKSWLIYFITIIGVYTAIAMIIAAVNKFTMGDFQGYDPNVLNYMFPGFLFLGGYIVSSLTFSDINDKFKSSLWFSLPGSSLEKYSVGVLVSSFGYSMFLILSFIAASTVSIIFTKPIFGSGMSVFNPFILGMEKVNDIAEYSTDTYGMNIMVLVLIYILSHSMFLVGSIVFKKGAFIKTLLSLLVVQAVFNIVLGIIGYVVFKSGIMETWDVRFFISLQQYLESHTDTQTFTNFMLKITFIFGIPFSLFFNIVGYFKLTEKEVKGGI